MPRWVYVTLCLVLFNAAMALVWWVLRELAPSAVAWLDASVGRSGSTIIIFGSIIAAGAYGLWPRDRQGNLRSPLPRRR